MRTGGCARAQERCSRKMSRLPWASPVPPSCARVRVGYLSHDLGDHPTGHLFNSVPALHVRGGGVEAVYFTLKGPEPSRYWRRLERDAGAGNGGVVYRVRIEDRGTEVSYTVCAWSNGGV